MQALIIINQTRLGGRGALKVAGINTEDAHVRVRNLSHTADLVGFHTALIDRFARSLADVAGDKRPILVIDQLPEGGSYSNTHAVIVDTLCGVNVLCKAASDASAEERAVVLKETGSWADFGSPDLTVALV